MSDPTFNRMRTYSARVSSLLGRAAYLAQYQAANPDSKGFVKLRWENWLDEYETFKREFLAGDDKAA